MTLNDIIATSLTMLERGNDAQTIDNYRQQFTKYANDAVLSVISHFKQECSDVVEIKDGGFCLSDLSHGCIRVTRVVADGKPVVYKQMPGGSGFFHVVTDAPRVTVVYRYVPHEMSSSTDVPELPEYIHRVIPYYVVACQRCGGDPQTQSTASAAFSIFNNMLHELERSSRGETDSFSLLNY